MSNIERIISYENDMLDTLEIPDFESRLTSALENKRQVGKVRAVWQMAVALLLFFLVGFNFDALAYYTKQIIGYDGVMSETLSSLNELGMGQLVGETVIFDHGPTVVIDALMMDDSQTILFYRVTGLDNDKESARISINMGGFLKEYHQSHGMGELGSDTTVWVQHYDPVRFYERSLKLTVTYQAKGLWEKKDIRVVIDRDKAMGNQLKLKMNKRLDIENQVVVFDQLLVAPTQTVLTGSIETDVLTFLKRGMHLRHIEIALYADGERVEVLSSGHSSDSKGLSFHFEYEPISSDVKVLKAKIETLSVAELVEDTFEMNEELIVHGEQIKVDFIESVDGQTHVGITTKEDVRLIDAALISGGSRIEIASTIDEDLYKTEDGIYRSRTMVFDGEYEDFGLTMKKLLHDKSVDEWITLIAE